MIDPLSQTSYYIECLFNDTPMANGTAFFVSRDEQTYLITNWHNVTGKNPITKEYLGSKAVSPTHLKVMVFKKGDYLDWVELILPLYDGDVPLWLEHPMTLHHEMVDVIALKVEVPADKMIFCVEQFIEPFNEKTQVVVKDDVFILGYPFGMTGGGLLPIWKRASIASEPIIDIDLLPKMYVDTASRSEMSGSPVIYMEKRPAMLVDGKVDTAMKVSRHYMQFVGVYLGRIGADDEFKAQLGIVWKSRVIDEIIYKTFKKDF